MASRRAARARSSSPQLDTRIAAAVCSCYFNNRGNKMIEPEYLAVHGAEEGLDYAAYLNLPEDDKFNPLAAPLVPDHLLGALICPRPFMVEIGKRDPVDLLARRAGGIWAGCTPSTRRWALPERAQTVCGTVGYARDILRRRKGVPGSLAIAREITQSNQETKEHEAICL